MGCFKLAFLFGGFPYLPTLPPTASSLISVDFFIIFAFSPWGIWGTVHMCGNDCNPTLLRCQGFLKMQHLLVLSTGWIPERGCVWSVCLLGWLVGWFLSYSFFKFNGTPLFSIRVNPELVAQQGKLASLPLGSWGWTDSGCHCPRVHRGRAPFLPAGAGSPPALR